MQPMQPANAGPNDGPQLGDIVLYNLADGTQIPGIITKVFSPTSVALDAFGVGGMGGSADPHERGELPGQWQPRPKHP